MSLYVALYGLGVKAYMEEVQQGHQKPYGHMAMGFFLVGDEPYGPRAMGFFLVWDEPYGPRSIGSCGMFRKARALHTQVHISLYVDIYVLGVVGEGLYKEDVQQGHQEPYGPRAIGLFLIGEDLYIPRAMGCILAKEKPYHPRVMRLFLLRKKNYGTMGIDSCILLARRQLVALGPRVPFCSHVQFCIYNKKPTTRRSSNFIRNPMDLGPKVALCFHLWS